MKHIDSVAGFSTQPQPFSIKPSPAHEILTVQFAISAATTACIEIIDVLGRKVISPVKDYITSGVYSQNIDVSSLSKGMYFCKLTLNPYRVLIQPFIIGAMP
jgi:hypothetical protein